MSKWSNEIASNYVGQNNLKLETTSLTVSVVDYVSPINEDWHFHEKKHALAILKGGNRETRSKKTTELKTGDTISYREGEKHCNRHVAYPSKNIIIEFDDVFFNSRVNFNNINANPRTFSTFLKVYHESIFQNMDSIENIYQSLYILLSDNFTDQHPLWLGKVKELLNDRWDEFISLDELSCELNLHPVTVSKYFSKYTDCTIAEYMRKIKVERAVKLLLKTSSKVSKIAYQCGFSDQSHMARLFKQYVGFTPREIRSL